MKWLLYFLSLQTFTWRTFQNLPTSSRSSPRTEIVDSEETDLGQILTKNLDRNRNAAISLVIVTKGGKFAKTTADERCVKRFAMRLEDLKITCFRNDFLNRRETAAPTKNNDRRRNIQS
jgi:hypothetical protein